MIVVLGGSGYVGSAIVEALGRRGLAYRSVSRTDCDYTSQRQLAALLEDVRPQFLINAAGFTGRPNVDACEAAKVDCLAGNALLPGVIRSCCEQVGVPWGTFLRVASIRDAGRTVQGLAKMIPRISRFGRTTAVSTPVVKRLVRSCCGGQKTVLSGG